MADPLPPGGYSAGGATGGGGSKELKVIKNLDQLSKLIPGYGELSVAQLLASPLFNGPDAYTIDPLFFKEFQSYLTALEAGYQAPVSSIPAGVFADPDKLKDLLKNAPGGGGGGGGGGSATPYGYSAPDPQGAASVMLTAWKYANDLITEGYSAQEAMAEFEAKWKELEADTNYRQASLDVNVQDTNAAQNRAENEDRRIRETQQAANRIAIADQATTRGRSVLQDYLPNAIQGATAFNFGGMRMPLMNVSPSQIFNQGGPGDLSQIPSINPNPATPYQQFQSPQLNPIGQMPNFPTPPVYQPPPDITALIQQIQSGTGPMGWA